MRAFIWLVSFVIATELITPALGEEPPTQRSSTEDLAAKKIREALDSGEPAQAPGLLGDVLDVIRQQGSILDGSSLDPDSEQALIEQPGADRVSNPSASATVRTAESLLKSARLLESLVGNQPEATRLVRQMRVQAATLLANLYLGPENQ